MTAKDLRWPDLPSVSVPEPAGTKGPWDRETYETRYKRQHREMLEAAGRSLGEHGYSATTVSEIVAGASVSKRTFYEHFKTRDDCFVELMRRISASMARELIRTAERFATAQPGDMFRELLKTEVASVRTGSHMAEALSGLARAGVSQRLAVEENQTQILLGRVFAVAARRMGSTLPPAQIEMTARLLSYAFAAEMRVTPLDEIDVAAAASVWSQAFGLAGARKAES
jgi:AcrR family transcriptional regulator